MTVGATIALLAFVQVREPQLKTAAHHQMKYYVSLPEKWSSKRRWPVILAIPDAERDFSGAAAQFAKARKQMPYILVVPMVVTNGGPGYRAASSYRYSAETWSIVDRSGEYTFDLQGIAEVLKDVRRLYSGEERVYATGFEAGGHTLFALTFRYPELLYASIPNSPNFQGRGLDESLYSKKPERTELPIHEINGEQDPFSAPGKPFFAQWEAATAAGRRHGFRNISSKVVKGKGHVWLADEILEYVNSLRKASKQPH